MFDRGAVLRELIDAGLGRVADQVADMVQPCIDIQPTPIDDAAIGVGESKFGGKPDVPAGFEWPLWKGEPLAFLGQIDLAALAGNPICASLPARGLLSFFYDREQSTWGFDPKDKGSWRVFFFEEEPFLRTGPPTPAPESADYAACLLTFADDVTFPSYQSPEVESLKLNREEQNSYINWDGEGPIKLRHHLLGHPQVIQNEMQLECQLVSNGLDCGTSTGYESPRVEQLEAGASQWRLLLQLDSDDDVGWMWGDVGVLYFWITDGDFAARRFESVWMILQCS